MYTSYLKGVPEMIRRQQRLYDIVAEAYKRHGAELVNEPYGNVHTCTVYPSRNETIVVELNSEVPYVNDWFDIVAEVKSAFIEKGYEIVDSQFFYDLLFIRLKK